MTDFFIIGPPRSGGTLVYSILCSDPGVNPMLMENHFVAQAASIYVSARARLDLEQGHFFSDREDARDFFSSWTQDFLDRLRVRYAPAEHLAIKSIALGHTCTDLAELLPRAKFVVSIRDPRDIVASMIAVGQKQEQAGGKNRYPRDIEQLSRSVMASYKSVARSSSESFIRQRYFLKYEELITNPEPTLAGLSEWTRLDFSGFDLAGDWPRSLRNLDDSRDGSHFLTEYSGSGISSTPSGRYRKSLTPTEITQVERLCAPMMKMFHYSVGE